VVDIEQLRNLLAAATPGTWKSQNYSNYAGWSIWAPDEAGCIAERWYATGTQDPIPRNDLLIAALHNAAPALLDELEAAREVIEKCEDALRTACEVGDCMAFRVERNAALKMIEGLRERAR